MELDFSGYLHWLGFYLPTGLGRCLRPSGPLVTCLVFVSAFFLLARLMILILYFLICLMVNGPSALLLLMMLHLCRWFEWNFSESN